ncbi:universal stress protein UspA [Haloprofundus marisrubri]|uniref:Universal stress protein UspA n=1 Tax=Haloprofundus marisrubri TaxID=1514971 RepID=A0A0W1RA65_9EURY|nr:universal stress protein [Haloprofundus marisrubri]KTG10230.1 universal stress protein UspA [Haloprofundus marisrubri]
MYDRILLPTDGSDAAEAAVADALELAETYDAELHVLYVVDTRTLATIDLGADTVLSALEEEGDAAVERIRTRAVDAGVDVVTAVEAGSPADIIVDYGEDHAIDLVVMATHGRRGLDRYLLGSVTERVVRSSEPPVLTVRYAESAE